MRIRRCWPFFNFSLNTSLSRFDRATFTSMVRACILHVEFSLSRSGRGHLTVENQEKNAVAEALEEEKCGLSEALSGFLRSEFFRI